MDISALLAAIWQTHASHRKVDAWLAGKSVAVCPLSELGFLRISTHPRGPFKAGMPDARELLSDFLAKHKCSFIGADLQALESLATESDSVTDCYLADLAQRHGMRMATLDARLKHASAQLIG